MALGGLKLSLLAGTALIIAAGPALAADLGKVSMKDAPVADPLTIAAYVQVTNDYIFRGLSQNARDGAVQGGIDLGLGMFYVGTFTSNVNFDEKNNPFKINAQQEIDLYGGIKPKVRDITFDFGVISYNYLFPNITHAVGVYDPSFVELKAGASTTILRDVSISGTAFFSPNYAGETGSTVTLEGTASKPLMKVAGIDWAASGTIGSVLYADKGNNGVLSNGALAGADYVYGNLGVTGTLGALSLDLRWWDTNLDAGKVPCGLTANQCGSAFAATFKLAY